MWPSVKSCNIAIFTIKSHLKYLKVAFFAELKSFVTFHTVFMMYLFRFTESQNSKLLRRLLFCLQVTKEKIFKMIKTVLSRTEPILDNEVRGPLKVWWFISSLIWYLLVCIENKQKSTYKMLLENPHINIMFIHCLFWFSFVIFS